MILFQKPEPEWPGDPCFRRLKIGPLDAERDSLTIKFSDKVFYNINISWPGYAYDNLVSGDGEWGPGKRLEFTIWPFGHWLIGLEKVNKFQQWSWKRGYWPPRTSRCVTWHPPRSWTCNHHADQDDVKDTICGAFLLHRGEHANVLGK